MRLIRRVLGGHKPESRFQSEPNLPTGLIDVEIATEANVREISTTLLMPSVELIFRQHFDTNRIHDADLSVFAAVVARVPFAEPPVFLDIGANVGNTLASLKALGCRFLVHSFEINPALHERLRVAANIYGNAIVRPFGLGSREETCWLYVPVLKDFFVLGEATLDLGYLKEDWCKQRLRSYAPGETLKVAKISVSIRTLDSLSLSTDLIKIDVEGAEDRVITGAIETLQLHRPLIMAENSYPEKVRSALASLGYSPFSFDTQANVLRKQGAPSQNAFWAEQTWQRKLQDVKLLAV